MAAPPRRPASHAATRAALLAALLAFAPSAPASAGWWDELGVPRPVTFESVRRAPDTWRDVPVILSAQFAGARRVGNPYFTQFTPASWRAFATWSADTPQSARRDDDAFARLFVRRGGATDRRAATLKIGQRIELRAVVRDTVRGEPWLEVLEITGDGDPLNALEQAELSLADRFLERRNAAAAEKRYRDLLGARALPVDDHASILLKLATAAAAQEDWTAATRALEQAASLVPDDALTEERLAQARAKLAVSAPATPLANAASAEAERERPTPDPPPRTRDPNGRERPPLVGPGPEAHSAAEEQVEADEGDETGASDPADPDGAAQRRPPPRPTPAVRPTPTDRTEPAPAPVTQPPEAARRQARPPPLVGPGGDGADPPPAGKRPLPPQRKPTPRPGTDPRPSGERTPPPAREPEKPTPAAKKPPPKPQPLPKPAPRPDDQEEDEEEPAPERPPLVEPK